MQGGIIKSVSAAVARWRHSRGFGVHSPFAYSMVTETLRPGRLYEWYGYFDIDATLMRHDNRDHDAWRIRDDARLLLRLTSRLRPGAVWLAASLHPAMATAVRTAGRGIRIESSAHRLEGCGLVVTHGGVPDAERLAERLTRGTAMMLIDAPADTVTRLAASMTDGVAFLAPGRAILIPRKEMAHVEYGINL